MTTIKTLFFLSFFFMLTISCDETKTPATEIQEKITNETTVVTTPIVEESLIIFQNSFLTISPGSQIAEHKASIEEGILQTGEGDFEIYNILDVQKNVVAYFFADHADSELVGTIYITSPLAQTEDGISMGDSFGDLVAKYSDLEVHGSEIESRTFANVGNWSFRINDSHSSYKLEISAVSKEAKIIEIAINR
jgi:hypothetical protein